MRLQAYKKNKVRNLRRFTDSEAFLKIRKKEGLFSERVSLNAFYSHK